MSDSPVKTASKCYLAYNKSRECYQQLSGHTPPEFSRLSIESVNQVMPSSINAFLLCYPELVDKTSAEIEKMLLEEPSFEMLRVFESHLALWNRCVP